MSDQFAPSTDPEGRFTRICPGCGKVFRTDNVQKKHCSYQCARKTGNRRGYQRRKARTQAVTERRQQQHPAQSSGGEDSKQE